jgi:hypothetical protein
MLINVMEKVVKRSEMMNGSRKSGTTIIKRSDTHPVEEMMSTLHAATDVVLQ